MGNRENTDVGVFLREYLDLEEQVEEVSRELKNVKGRGWMGRVLRDEKVGGEGDHYEGDFRKRDCGCGGVGEGHVH